MTVSPPLGLPLPAPEITVPLPEVQGIILRGYEDLQEATFLLLQFPDAEAGRRWLRGIVTNVRNATARPTSDDTAVNLAFTAAGLWTLGLREEVPPEAPPNSSRFSREFLEGMDTPHRRRVLGDTGCSAPETWDWGRQDTRPENVKGVDNPHNAPVIGDVNDRAATPPKLIHGLVLLYAGDKAALRALCDGHVKQLHAAGINVILTLDTEDLLGRKEQFGFRDGIGQPLVRGVRKEEPVTETEPPAPDNLIAPGEILLGFPNAYTTTAANKASFPVSPVVTAANGTGLVDFGYCGSYLVFRQLRQDVLKFWQFIYGATKRADRSEKDNQHDCVKLATKMVGRWPSGAPVALSPDQDNKSLADSNAYGFDENDGLGVNDRLGRRVPIGSHTRRANPRDSLEPGPGGEGRLTREESLRVTRLHRLMRRGRPYGPPIASSMQPEDILKVGVLISRYEAGDIPAASPEAQVDFKKEAIRVLGGQRVDESMSVEEIIGILRHTVGQDRGLHFLCFNANIARQFEFVQQTWVNNPKFGGLYGDNDPIMGQRHTAQGGPADTFNEQASPVRKQFRSLPEFVTVRGGAYFLMPGINALKYLAGLPNELPPVKPEDLV